MVYRVEGESLEPALTLEVGIVLLTMEPSLEIHNFGLFHFLTWRNSETYQQLSSSLTPDQYLGSYPKLQHLNPGPAPRVVEAHGLRCS